MNKLFLSTSTVAIALISSPVMAASKIVTINDLTIANGKFTIQVPAGDGVVIDLSEISQTVKGAVFGDPTKFVISGIDGQLCYMQKDKCQATGASVVLLRPVKGVEIPTQSHSPDGSTTVTLITDGNLGSKVLHMLLIPSLKAPYTAIVARKDFAPVHPVATSRIESSQVEPHLVYISELPPSLNGTNVNGATNSKSNGVTMNHNLLNESSEALVSTNQAKGNSVATVLPNDHSANLQQFLPSVSENSLLPNSSEINSDSTSATSELPSLNLDESNSVTDGYAVAVGVLVAKKIGWIKPQTIIWNKAQKAIAQLLQGENKTTASDKTGLDPKDLSQLLAWGQSAITLLRQGENLASIAGIVRAKVVRDSERTLLLQQLAEWSARSS